MRTTHKAPALAWLLTALTCLLAGMAIVEGRYQAVARPIRAPVGPVEPGEAGHRSTEAPAPGRTPTLTPGERAPPPPAPWVADVPLALPSGPAILQVTRLVVRPGVGLPPEAAAGPTVLLVESGALSVRAGGAAYLGQSFGAAPTDTVLRSGERLVVAAGEGYAVRNDGTLPAVALAGFDTSAPPPCAD